MKYLLSTNKTTTDIVEYISDFIRLNLSIRKSQIPYFKGGTDDIIHSVVYSELESNVRSIVKDIIDRLSEYHVNVSLKNVVIKTNNILIIIDINNKSYTYDITAGDI